MSTKQFCTFFLNGKFFGVAVEEVQEIIRFQDMTHVPLAHPVITGMINLRGHIVTAMDLRRRLGMNPGTASNELPINVVIRKDDNLVSFLVDEIGDIMELDDGAFESPPATLTGSIRELISGAYKLENRLLLILNVAQTLNLNGTDEGTELDSV